MSSYTRWSRASDLSRFGYTVKWVDHEGRTDHDVKKVAVQSSEKDTTLTSELTLEDFGGRSDALGG
jgi:hypothetical protein